MIREKFEAHREAVNILSMKSEMLVNFIPTGNAIHESSIVLELRQLMEEVKKIFLLLFLISAVI